jgi:hypothetical protein
MGCSFFGCPWQGRELAQTFLWLGVRGHPHIPSSFVARPQMLLDISPLCLYHNIPMILTHYWFDCPLNGCTQRYDMGRGYYVMRENAVEDVTNKKPCPDCSLRLYLAKRVPTLGDSMWLCANEQCPSNRRKRIHTLRMIFLSPLTKGKREKRR